MGKFKFELASILKLKEQIEKNVENELAKAFAVLKYEEKKLYDMKCKLKEIIDEMKTCSGKTAVGKLKEYSTYIDYFEDRIEEQKNIVNHAAKNVDIIKRKLIEAMKERKVFEKLREKKLEEYMLEELKNEQKAVDEVVSYKQNAGNTNDGR